VTREARVASAEAPIRVCDLGGWTDTWFARHGAVLNVAVQPSVHVTVTATPRASANRAVTLDLHSYGDRYSYAAGTPVGRHPLLEATVAEVPTPENEDLHVSVRSGVPPGASTGTSGAVTVALVAALRALAGQDADPQEIAGTAHRVETERLGLQSGIQDQLCAAYGGVSFIDMPDYPQATVTSLALAQETCAALDERIVLVFLGRTHVSSDVHLQVIEGLAAGHGVESLEVLRALAMHGRDALLAGDVDAFGRALIANTEAQRSLHPSLVSAQAQALFDRARDLGAVGWKVNGAGGEGGSVSILLGGAEPVAAARGRLTRELAAIDSLAEVVPTSLRRYGVRATVGRPVG
jgi:D-glycero-alpha-D-manno-heptose-7-phosphate kinase